jgi:hypothetical protein
MTAKRIDEAQEFLASYPAAVSELALSLRSIIVKTIPDAKETVDRSGRVIGYVVGPGYAGLACTIIPSKQGVKLGLVGGVDLADPLHLMEGSGKRHRYVQFNTRSDLERPGVSDLILSAKAAAVSRART